MILNIVSIIPVIIIVIGVIGNTCAFLIFTLNKEMNKYSSMVYLSIIAVMDTIGLFQWNLNHFLRPNFGIAVDHLDLFSCKFFSFVQYASLQSSGLLYSVISVDRYFTVISKPGSFASRLPFGTRKSAFVWSICIIIGVSLFNAHLFLSGYYKESTVNATSIGENNSMVIVQKKVTKLICYDSIYYRVLPLWDQIQVVVYSIVPFLIMGAFNILLIVNVLLSGSKKAVVKNNNQNGSDKKKFRLTVSLVCMTFAFILMTSPGTWAYGFFYDNISQLSIAKAVFTIMDSLMFLQQTMIFLISFLTNKKFSGIVTSIIRCQKIKSSEQQVKPTKTGVTKELNLTELKSNQPQEFIAL